MHSRPLLEHLEKIKKDLREKSAFEAFAFAAACGERAWSVYKRASQGKAWENQAVLRTSLDTIWKWLSGQGNRPHSLAQQCELAVFEDEHEEPSDAGGFYVANSIYGLESIVENDQPEHSYQSAQSNLDLLDAFLYGLLGLLHTPENDIIVDKHELIRREMEHQLEDLDLLQDVLTSALVSKIRKRSEGKSILGGYWYNG